MRKYYQRRLPEDPSKDYYYIIRETSPMQSLLVEYGFIDNANDREKLENDLLNYVEAVVRAIAQYAGVTYIPPSGVNTYTVQRGDTLYSIANRFGVTVQQLRDANNLTSDVLNIGQILKIPSVNNDNNNGIIGGNTYTVQRGDTLFSIASRYGISVNDLRRANNLTSDVLSVGQVLVIPGLSNEDSGTSNITYTVQRGDTLYSIANRFGVSVMDIMNTNSLTSTALSIGQVLIIPGGNASGDDSNTGGAITYTVQRGDSLYSIANRYGISVNALKNANNLTSNLLNIGQVLVIPTSDTGIDNYFNYTVQRGDSLWLIANRYNTTVDEIKRLNNLTSNLLNIGQVLRIPNS